MFEYIRTALNVSIEPPELPEPDADHLPVIWFQRKKRIPENVGHDINPNMKYIIESTQYMVLFMPVVFSIFLSFQIKNIINRLVFSLD